MNHQAGFGCWVYKINYISKKFVQTYIKKVAAWDNQCPEYDTWDSSYCLKLYSQQVSPMSWKGKAQDLYFLKNNIPWQLENSTNLCELFFL